jgi:peptide/nickel transport system permease protein
MRGEMLEVLGQDYIRTARAKGLPERAVTYKHALRNAILVIVATIGGVLPGLVGGAGTVEFVLRWPGITPLFISSIFAQDVYVIMAMLTILTVLLMVGNVISDIALALIDPRIRY